MRSRKKEYNEEEENAPLITKDKFNEILKTKNKKNKILNIIISIIICMSLAIIFYKFIISILGFEISKNILKATNLLEMLKIDIYVLGILSITYCINENENFTDISNIHSEAKLKIKSTENHIKLLQDQLNIIINNKLCSQFFNILHNKIYIYNLNEDWTSSFEKVELIEELRSMSFKIFSLSYSNEICNISSIFFENIKSKADNGYLQKANEIQKNVYYFLRNLLTSYKEIFNNLSEESVITIEKLWENYQFHLYIMLISLIIIIFLLIIIYMIKVYFDYLFYQLLILYYYNIDNEQLKLEYQIFYLNKIINEFNCNNIDYFEYIKNYPNSYFFNKDINKSNINSIKNNNLNQNNILHSNINQRKNYKRGNSLYNNLEKIKVNDNESFLNGSMNGSSLLFLNANHKIINNIDNKNSFSTNINGNNEKNISKEESIDSLINLTKKIVPRSLKLSLFFILLGNIIYLLVCFGNIISLSSEDVIWKYSINLSMNIFERIPRLIEILIYSYLTIISNIQFKDDPFGDNQSKYLKYFEANSFYYSEEIMSKYFKNNYFGQLLRDNLRINYNIDNYLFQEKDNIFTNTKQWETLLRKRGDFCINAAIGEVISFQEEYSVYEFAKLIDYYGTNCLKDNTGINESGSQLEITYILQEITNKYIEFLTYNNTNISLLEARKKFLGLSPIKRINVDMQLSLILYYNSITYAVNKDFEKKIVEIINQQILFSEILFLINFIIIIGLYFSIKKNEKYKILFAYFSKLSNHD